MLGHWAPIRTLAAATKKLACYFDVAAHANGSSSLFARIPRILAKADTASWFVDGQQQRDEQGDEASRSAAGASVLLGYCHLCCPESDQWYLRYENFPQARSVAHHIRPLAPRMIRPNQTHPSVPTVTSPAPSAITGTIMAR